MKTGILLLVLGIVLLIAAVGLALYFRSHPMADPSIGDVPSEDNAVSRQDIPETPPAVLNPDKEKTELLCEEEAS